MAEKAAGDDLNSGPVLIFQPSVQLTETVAHFAFYFFLLEGLKHLASLGRDCALGVGGYGSLVSAACPFRLPERLVGMPQVELRLGVRRLQLQACFEPRCRLLGLASREQLVAVVKELLRVR